MILFGFIVFIISLVGALYCAWQANQKIHPAINSTPKFYEYIPATKNNTKSRVITSQANTFEAAEEIITAYQIVMIEKRYLGSV